VVGVKGEVEVETEVGVDVEVDVDVEVETETETETERGRWGEAGQRDLTAKGHRDCWRPLQAHNSVAHLLTER